MRAAKYLGVPVWELLKPEHRHWIEPANAALTAEIHAAEVRAQRASKGRT